MGRGLCADGFGVGGAVSLGVEKGFLFRFSIFYLNLKSWRRWQTPTVALHSSNVGASTCRRRRRRRRMACRGQGVKTLLVLLLSHSEEDRVTTNTNTTKPGGWTTRTSECLSGCVCVFCVCMAVNLWLKCVFGIVNRRNSEIIVSHSDNV